MSPLWSHVEASMATGGVVLGKWQADGVSIDSRTVKAGDLFVAIKGPRSDGHDYVSAAIAKGASAAMVTQKNPVWREHIPLLVVSDTNTGLSELGRFARNRISKKGHIIGVTGSVGKTGIKEALRHCLERQAPTCATKGNLNNKWGLPLSLARMPRTTTYGIFEVGMSCPGEITSLSSILKPDIAIISTVEAVHIEFFKSVEEIADAKAEIFHGMDTNGIAILNGDNDHYAKLEFHAKSACIAHIFSFGSNKKADARLIKYSLGTDFSTIEADIFGEVLKYQIALPGRHWALNSLAVLAAVKAGDGNVSLAAESLRELPSIKGRGKTTKISIPGGYFTLIDESYNASPVSVRAALGVLADSQPHLCGRRIAILGDMLELGESSDELHEGLLPIIKESMIDVVFTVGTKMAALATILPDQIVSWHKNTSDEIIPEIINAVQIGDVVTVKGSLGSRMGLIVDALKALCEDKKGIHK